jgi:hypothetical protein
MTTHTLRHHQASQSGLARWIGTGALAGALSVIVFHQAVAALLFALGVTERMPYSTQPSAPFGVPQLWSIAFWGGLWGIALAAALRGLRGAKLIFAATLFGALLPTLVAWTVVALLKGQPLFAGGLPAGIATGLLVNAAWGLGTGVGLALLASASLRARSGQGGERARRMRFLP